MTSEERGQSRIGIIYAVVAVAFFGSSALLARYANAVSSFEKGFWRLIVAALCLLIIGRLLGQKLVLPRDRVGWARFGLYGFVTAGHFATYLESLNHTSTAHTLTILYTSPILVALMSWFFLHERIKGRQWLGVLVAVGGVAVLASETGGSVGRGTGEMLLGDLLALASAVFYALYSIAGRREREAYPLFSYAFAVYALAGLWMLPLALFNFDVRHYDAVQIAAVVALGVAPLGIGHTLYNAALRRINATYANVIATQEVTLGVLATWLLQGETPTGTSLVGALITLVGVVFVLV